MAKILIGALVVIGATGGFLYLLVAQDTSREVATSQSAEDVRMEAVSEEQQQSVSDRGTLLTALQLGENLQCVFSAVDTESQTEGTLWLAGDQYSLEARTRAEGELYVSNMIRTNDQLYIWSGTAQGSMAIVMEAPESMFAWSETTSVSDQFGKEVDLNQEVAYDCEPWTPNQSQFLPPADIDFVDMEAMMQGMFDGELRGVPEGMDF